MKKAVKFSEKSEKGEVNDTICRLREHQQATKKKGWERRCQYRLYIPEISTKRKKKIDKLK